MIVWGEFSWDTLDPFAQTEPYLISIKFIVADDVHPFGVPIIKWLLPAG